MNWINAKDRKPEDGLNVILGAELDSNMPLICAGYFHSHGGKANYYLHHSSSYAVLTNFVPSHWAEIDPPKHPSESRIKELEYKFAQLSRILEL